MSSLFTYRRSPIFWTFAALWFIIICYNLQPYAPVGTYRDWKEDRLNAALSASPSSSTATQTPVPEAGTAPPAETSPPSAPEPARPAYEYPFKLAKEWKFDVPKEPLSDPAGAKPEQIMLLTASDGGGNNGAIENLATLVGQNRQDYCDYHGYHNVFLNVSKYDIGPAHKVWAKLPAIAEAFNLYPEVEWIWFLDLDVIIMTPELGINEHVLTHKALNKYIMRNQPWYNGTDEDGKVIITDALTPANLQFEDLDIIISQDHQQANVGSWLIRRSLFTKWLLDVWADRYFMERLWEQNTLNHLALEHAMIREHIGFVPQRLLNSYPVNTIPNMNGPKEIEAGDIQWVVGDLAVHLAGCWVDQQCQARFDAFWNIRRRVEDLPDGKSRLELARQRRGEV